MNKQAMTEEQKAFEIWQDSSFLHKGFNYDFELFLKEWNECSKSYDEWFLFDMENRLN